MPQTAHEYSSGLPAITDVVSGSQDIIALVYGHSSKDTVNAVAFKVWRSVRRREYIEDPFNGSIADGATKGFGYFGENGFSPDVTDPGDELFEILEQQTETIQEYGFAVPQDGVYVGVEAGDGDAINGLRENSDRDRGFGPDDLDSFGGVLSDHTRIATPAATQEREVPTTALSTEQDHGVIRVDSDQQGPNRFYFGFKNVSGGPVTIDLEAWGQTYEVEQIKDTETVRSLLVNDEARVMTYGGFGNQNPNLPREWYNAEAEIRQDELLPTA